MSPGREENENIHLGHGLGALRNGVFRKFARKDKSYTRLYFSRRNGRFLRVSSEL